MPQNAASDQGLHCLLKGILIMMDGSTRQMWVKRCLNSLNLKTSSYEPPHDKTNKMACAPSEDSDQPGHPPSLISLRCPHEESWGPYSGANT